MTLTIHRLRELLPAGDAAPGSPAAIVGALDGLCLYIGHDLCFAGPRTIVIGETDTIGRAGYLWECSI